MFRVIDILKAIPDMTNTTTQFAAMVEAVGHLAGKVSELFDEVSSIKAAGAVVDPAPFLLSTDRVAALEAGIFSGVVVTEPVAVAEPVAA